MNIYLAVYCRRLNRDLRIVSRITHERNLEAIHRAGADFVLSYTTLGIEAAMSVLRGHPPVVLGEGVELFFVPVPASLAGKPLRDTGIGRARASASSRCGKGMSSTARGRPRRCCPTTRSFSCSEVRDSGRCSRACTERLDVVRSRGVRRS